MTVPGVRVTSVRRTVGVAVALVTGQALLCGIIGIVTFGGDGASAPGGVEPQLAGPPVVVPTGSEPAVSGPVKRPEPGTARSGRVALPTSPPAPAATRRSTTPTSSPSRTASPQPEPPPAPVIAPSDRVLLPPTPPGFEEDQPAPPVEKERCDEEGATGRTAGGETVRCERDRDGGLRWRLV